MLTQEEITSIIAQVKAEIAAGAEGLEFEPVSHTYTYNGTRLPAVSDVCKIFEKNFDSDRWADLKAAEAGVSKEEMLRRWKDNSRRACEEGTEIHSYGEWHFHRHTGEPIDDPELREIDRRIREGNMPPDARAKCIDQVWEAIAEQSLPGYRVYPLASENRIVNPELGYAGTFDLLCLAESEVDGRCGLVIFDYKTNGNLFNIYRPRGCDIDRMNKPLDSLAACNAANYACQLNLYQLGLERVTSVPVLDRILLWVEPDGVAAIDDNNMESYYALHRHLEQQGTKSKWKFAAYQIQDIDSLKCRYSFRRHKTFGMLHLPDLREPISSYIRQLQS